MLDSSKPLLFAAMPFGEKSEPGGSRIVDFDTLYEQCVKPAAAMADVEVIRADEEALGGIIHRPMYERLLLSEIVIADLTFANANVFYELGVRHAARPRSTILMYAKVGQLPFDVGLIRAIPYELDAAGALVDPPALRDELSTRLALARDDDAADSPLFQLLDDYPGIDLTHDVTEAFRARAVWVSELTVRAHEAAKPPVDVAAAAAILHGIEAETSGVRGSEEQLLVMLMLAYRDISAWEDMIRVAESLPARLRAIATIREQLAMALSRRNGPGDRTRAIDVVERVIEEFGESPESLGILGRCFKARCARSTPRTTPGPSTRSTRRSTRTPAGSTPIHATSIPA